MYKFPLGAVLKHRRHLEENLQKELGVLKRQLSDDKEKLSELKTSKKKYFNELISKQQEIVTVSDSLIYIRFIDRLSRRLEIQNELVTDDKRNVDKKRSELLEALKMKKILEKLKERGLEVYRKNALKKERSFLNEMASVRFRRKM